MPDSFDGLCSLWPGADPGGRMKGKQQALRLISTHIKNVRTKCIILGEELRIMVKKFKQDLLEN